MDALVIKMGNLWNPTAQIFTRGVKLLALTHWVEYTKERRRIGTSTGRPLPSVSI